MNLFVLDLDLVTNATYHCDKHVVKLILESAQVVCTVCSQYNIVTPYRPTHKNHPIVKWAAQTIDNYIWVCRYGLALCDEYTFRYNKIHKSKSVLDKCLSSNPSIQLNGLLPFVQAMPDHCKIPDDAVLAYRTYYKQIKTKTIKCTWTKRPIPFFLT